MNSFEHQVDNNRITAQDICRFQFKINYKRCKLQIKTYKEIIEMFKKERDIYHLNIWKEKLIKIEYTLQCYEYFISVFPAVMNKTDYEKSIDLTVEKMTEDKSDKS